MNLIDTKGYRSKYINALNSEAKRIRVVGGDVIPEETEAGTLLRTKAIYSQARFELFRGLAELESGSLSETLCVGDGSFFINGEIQKLKNATNTRYLSKGVRPRSSGWISKGAPEKGSSGNAWQKCEVVILRYLEDYFIAFRYDDMELYKLVSTEEDASEIESEIEVVLIIGVFTFASGAIVQNVNSDIFYTTDKIKELLPWDIILHDGKWYIVDPIWTLAKPTIAENVTEPQPLEAVGLPKKSDNSSLDSVEVRGKRCYKLEEVSAIAVQDLYTHAYAVLMTDGKYGISLRTAKDFSERANCVYLGQFTRDKKEPETIISWTQSHRGAIASKWTETEPYYVQSNSSGNMRYVEAPTGLDEGTTMFRHRFWKLRTEINKNLFREDEDLDFQGDGTFPKEQKSTTYGNYIWRHRLFYDKRNKALLIDEITTAVLNVEVSTFATLMPTPYVTRVEVTYPETPLQQGSVDAVGGTINVLAVGPQETSRTNLFRTESIDTTDGSIIEVE